MKTVLSRSLLFLTLLASNLPADPLDNWHRRNPRSVWDTAYGNGIFVTIGDQIQTSTNGIDWMVNRSSTTHGLFGITYGNALFVAVGITNSYATNFYPTTLGTILTSTNGVDWTPRLVSTNANMRRVAYGNGTFVAAGYGNSILTSTNGMDWSWRELPTWQTIEKIVFANGTFVAVGSTILTSTDGVNWAQTFSIPYDFCRGVTYGNGLFVATSDKGQAVTSPDGISWTKREAVTGYGLLDVTFGNGLFVASTMTTSMLTSTDATNWTVRTPGFAVSRLNYHNGLFFGFGSFYNVFWTSSDGISWSNLISGFDGIHNRVIYANQTFVAVGDRESILTSSNGVSWTERRGGGTHRLVDIAYGNGSFVAVGWPLMILTSSNLIDWTAKLLGTNSYFSSVAFGNNMFVATTFSGGGWTSFDTINWTQVDELPAARAITYGGGLFAAVAGLSASWISSDGSNWTRGAFSAFPTNATGVDLRSIVYGNGTFVAVGGDDYDSRLDALIVTSSDGTNWVYRAPGIPGVVESITFGDDMFVGIGGRGGIVTSKNGTDWFSRPALVAGSSVAYGNNTFVAISLVTIVQSDPFVRLSLSEDLSVLISAMVDRTYRIDATSDLGSASSWQPLATVSLTNSPYLWRDDSTNLPDKRFYRAVLVP